LTFKERTSGEAALTNGAGEFPLEWRGDRLVLPQETADSDRLAIVERLVDVLAAA
jgi:hypothetical protein